MNIVVCIKQILDPEIRPRDFKIEGGQGQAATGATPLVISPYDENAIEVALQLKERLGSTVVTAMTVGGAAADKALRRALGMGCDEGVWLKDAFFEDLDSMGTARVLGKAIAKVGGVDLVLCGLQAGDWDMGQVGFLLAEELSLPCISSVYKLEPKDDALAIHRSLERGTEIVKAAAPLLGIVANHAANLPRYPSAKRIIMAGRKQLTAWTAADLGVNQRIARRVTIERLTVPNYDRQVEIMDADTGPEKSIKLVEKMIELKLI